jgi:hypothetical protein
VENLPSEVSWQVRISSGLSSPLEASSAGILDFDSSFHLDMYSIFCLKGFGHNPLGYLLFSSRITIISFLLGSLRRLFVMLYFQMEAYHFHPRISRISSVQREK